MIRAGEQLVVEGLAQLLQRLGERRLGHLKPLGGPGQVALFQQHLQGRQQIEIYLKQLT